MVDKKLIMISSAFLIDPLIVLSFNPLVPTIKTAFNVDITLVALSTTFHMLPLSVLCLFSGTLSDLFYRPKILSYGLFIAAVGLLLNALSPNISMFLVSRSLQGTGTAFIMPTALALIGDTTPRKEIGKAMGLNSMVTAIFGASFGPLISGYLGEINWRLVPLYLAILSLSIGVLCRIVLRGVAGPQESRSVTLVVQKIKHAAMDRNIALLSVVGFISMFAWSGVQPLIADTLSLSPFLLKESEIGTIYSTIGFIGIVFAYIGGILTDKLGAKKNMLFGLMMEILPVFLLIFATSYWSYLILLAIHGSFMKVTQASRSTLTVGLMPEARGSASSVVQFAQFLGYSMSPLIMPQIYVSSGINVIYMADVGLLLLSVIFLVLIQTD